MSRILNWKFDDTVFDRPLENATSAKPAIESGSALLQPFDNEADFNAAKLAASEQGA